MKRLPPMFTRTYTRFPSPALFRSGAVTTGTPYVSANDPEATSRGGDPNRVDPAIAYTYYLTLTVQQTRPEITDGDIYTERAAPLRSEEHTSELQSLMRNSYAVFCL